MERVPEYIPHKLSSSTKTNLVLEQKFLKANLDSTFTKPQKDPTDSNN